MTQLILLNGASSSGKTTLARALQEVLPGLWLRFGIDDLVAALPPSLLSAGDNSGEGISFAAGGEVSVGAAFRQAEAAWMAGIAATVHSGAAVIVDDVFLSGAASQRRWQAALGELPCLWVGVHVDPAEAEKREQARPDRTPGMHRQQAGLVHVGVRYDLQVDTSGQTPQAAAQQVRAALNLLPPMADRRQATV